MERGSLHLGVNDKGETIKISVEALKRHVAILGSSGSGKTVLAKVILEEAAINGIPSIIVDPQGDLSSLAIVEPLKNLEKKLGFEKERRDQFKRRAEMRIFTPASSKGIPISINPLKFPEKKFSQEEKVRALDLTSTSLTQLIGYSLNTDSGRACQNFLYTLLNHCWSSKRAVKDFEEFSQIAREPEKVGFKEPEKLLTHKLRANIATKLNYLSIGMEKLLFNFGTTLDIDNFLTPVEEGKIPINILYLNTLTSRQHKQFFVAMLAKELYTWMLQNPSESVQLIFYIDEVGPYLPPHPYNPASKEMINFLFKQGRKYGISCVMCTQNPADVEYKALGQANTLAFGRMMAKQDLDKIRHILKSSSPFEASRILSRLPSLKTGNFILVSPDVYKEAQSFKVRWLYTRHVTLDEDHLRKHIPHKILNAFKRHPTLPGERVRPTHALLSKPKVQRDAGVQIERERKPKIVEEAEEKEFFHLKLTMGRKKEKSSMAKLRDVVSRKGQKVKDKFSHDLTETSLISDVNIKLSQATKLARKVLKTKAHTIGGGEKLNLGGGRLVLLPLWCVRFLRVVKKRLWFFPFIKIKREEERGLFFSAENGQLLQLGERIFFSNEPRKGEKAPRDFDEVVDFRETSNLELPAEKPVPKIDHATIATMAAKRFNINPRYMKFALLPSWELELRDEQGNLKRKVYIDATLGKVVEW